MDDTIVAISTALSPSAISIVRVTGKDAIEIVNKVFKGKDLTKEKTHTIHYGYIVDNNEVIDEVLIMMMRAPKTYTVEDTVEINCHGGINSTKEVLELLLHNGCRMAEPGEFTKRAYLNGRINLLEAESVNDLIMAKTDALRKMSLNNMGGKLTNKIKNIREKLVKILANIEVNIDYPEYTDEVEVTKEMLNIFIKDVSGEIKTIVEDSKNGQLIKNGLNVAIIGKPNVGKSSILNYLLDEEKAIVTSIPGTTRDIVEGSITLDGILINFIDTAGIRKTSDIVEQIGVDKSKKMADQADLIIFVLNNNEDLTKEELELLKKYDQDKVIIFINKNDLDNNLKEDKLSNYHIVKGNTVSEKGLDSLKKEIIKMYSLDEITSSEMSYLSNVRQIDLITKANDSIISAREAMKKGVPVDLIEIDLKNAWELLGELIGDAYNDELVDNIFSNFCLGK